MIASLFSRIRKGEIESGAPIDFAFGPYSASVTLNDTLHDGQADAGALELLSAVKSLEDAEEFFRVSRIESRAVVPDKINRFTFLLLAANFYNCLLPLARKFECIGQQIDEDLFKQ